jgi:hypothetical protein
MATRKVNQRAQEYIDLETKYVDINQCVTGSNARAIKPGGIVALKESIKDQGYDRVPTPGSRH